MLCWVDGRKGGKEGPQIQKGTLTHGSDYAVGPTCLFIVI